MKLTIKDRARNRKSTRYETLNGKRQSLIEWAEEYGQPYARVQMRLLHGWTLQQALETPKQGAPSEP